MIQILWYFLQTYWIPVVSLIFIIFAFIILRQAIKDASEMPDNYFDLNSKVDQMMYKEARKRKKVFTSHLILKKNEIDEMDEHSPEFYFGDENHRTKYKDYVGDNF